MEKIIINHQSYDGWRVALPHSTLIFIAGQKGVLGCGFFNVETANKINEPLAVVTGVKTFDDMLKKEVIAVSNAAMTLGIKVGMTGKEALEKL